MYGIITSKSLWLTSLQSSNDAKELRISKKILDDVLNDYIGEVENPKDKELFERILNGPKDNVYRKYRKTIKYYGLSCVNERDSLIHWDRYGDKGEGVCIGINLAILDSYIKMCYGAFTTWLTHGEITYREDEQKKKIQQSLLDIINFYKSMSIDLEKDLHITSVIYYSILNNMKPFHKDIGFEGENEYRLLFQEREGEYEAKFYDELAKKNGDECFKSASKDIMNALTDLGLLFKDKKFGKFRDMIRGYYALDLSEVWSDTLISEIVLGSKCLQEKNELKEFLKRNDLYHTDILVSNIPMR